MRLSRSFWKWIAPGLAFALIGGGVAVAGTHRFYTRGEGSTQARQFVTSLDMSPITPSPMEPIREFGHDRGKKTLLLHDTAGPQTAIDESSATQAGALASHFGKVTMRPVTSYTSQQMLGFDAVIYVGQNEREKLPAAFLADVRAQLRPVLWMAASAPQLAEGPEGPAFVKATGWDPREIAPVGTAPNGVQYRDTRLEFPSGVKAMTVGSIKAPATVLSPYVCPSVARCQGLPWAIRTGKLFYFADDVFAYTSERSRHLVFADVLYDLFDVQVPTTRRASVRLEDIDANMPAEKLKRVVDMLADRHIPFQMAVIAIRIDKTDDGESWRGVPLSANADLVAVLKYALTKGGTLVQHGTTHQWGDTMNPYSGESAADYEFIRAVCSSRPHTPSAVEPCRNESWISIAGPLPQDDVVRHWERIRAGQDEFRKAGLPAPTLFTTPHYAASPRAYAAIVKSGLTRYERVNYFSGLTTGRPPANVEGDNLPAPYATHDIYGGLVLPETLGNISTTTMNNHPARSVDSIVTSAKAQGAVRESVASFYFHPFLNPDFLQQTLDGLTMQGFGFVSEEEVSKLYTNPT